MAGARCSFLSIRDKKFLMTNVRLKNLGTTNVSFFPDLYSSMLKNLRG